MAFTRLFHEHYRRAGYTVARIVRALRYVFWNGEETTTMATLKDIPCGQTATVLKLTGEGAVKRRIMDMGITKGTEVFVRKVAPLGDPIEVTVRGYELSIRKSEAEKILVTD